MSTYADFLATKTARVHAVGPAVSRADIHPMLHDWQAELVEWAARVGRAAIWADTGLGKTIMQVEWARLELKESYWRTAVDNCRDIEAQITAPSLIPLDECVS